MGSSSDRILIVDDDMDMCWVLSHVLKSTGRSVTTTTSGVKALDLVAGSVYHTVLVDAKLGDYDGLCLAAHIREQSPYTTVILISGYFYAEDCIIRDGIRQDLLYGFIAKPFEPHLIRSLVYQAIAQSRRNINDDEPYFAGRR